jgi:hypothetical protein
MRLVIIRMGCRPTNSLGEVPGLDCMASRRVHSAPVRNAQYALYKAGIPMFGDTT